MTVIGKDGNESIAHRKRGSRSVGGVNRGRRRKRVDGGEISNVRNKEQQSA